MCCSTSLGCSLLFTIAGMLEGRQLKIALEPVTEVHLRLLGPQDCKWVEEFCQRLERKTIYYRFLSAGIPHNYFERLLAGSPQSRVALAAFDLSAGSARLLGLGECALESASEKRGDLALLVGERWQRMNLGTKLFQELLKIAQDWGLQTAGVSFLEENIGIRKLLCRIERAGLITTLNSCSSYGETHRLLRLNYARRVDLMLEHFSNSARAAARDSVPLGF